jgi:cysteine desulfurase / selenocysteine lyase
MEVQYSHMLDVKKIRTDFPILKRQINGKPLVYLDSTATSLKPNQVINKLNEYYTQYTANIFRGIYTLSEEATREYEHARSLAAQFIHAKTEKEIIFTRNTTESLNLVTYGWLLPRLHSTDSVAATSMDHHSNFVPWQQIAKKCGAKWEVLLTKSDGFLDLPALDKIITKKTKLFAFPAVSNVFGTINPVADIVKKVRALNPNCCIVVDAAQAAPHLAIDVQSWDADFVAFSSHKMLGPTGVGVLWGKMERLEELTPFLYGGEMIKEVRIEETFFNEIPHKFEAGTPAIGEVIGFGAAIEYLNAMGMDSVREHEKMITEYALKKMQSISGITFYGPKAVEHKGGVVAFTMDVAHAHDIAQILNEDNICIRSGHHCAMPLHTQLNIRATARASFYIYTTKEDVDMLCAGLIKVQEMFTKKK